MLAIQGTPRRLRNGFTRRDVLRAAGTRLFGTSLAKLLQAEEAGAVVCPRAKSDTPQWGRGHWSYCFPALLADAGIRGGAPYGRSDKDAAWPADQPVSPETLAATIFYSLGISPDTHIHDAFGRPVPVVEGGLPLRELFG